MSDTPRTETPNTRRRRWRVLVTLALLALLAGGVVVGWRSARKSLSDEERHLVGTWTVQWDGTPGSDVIRYEFRPDRTCRVLNLDPKSLRVLNNPKDLKWRLSDGELIVRMPGAAHGPVWLPPSRRSVDEIIALTPDGPDRFRYTTVVEVRSTPLGPPVTGTMTRVTPTE